MSRSSNGSDPSSCLWCDNSCAHPRFDELSIDDLEWLWSQLAAVADRSGDVALTTGTTTVSTPESASELSAGRAVLGRSELLPGRALRIDLVALGRRCAPVTPGALAAHAVGRSLAPRHTELSTREATERSLCDAIAAGLTSTSTPWTADVEGRFRRSGALSRLVALNDPFGVANRAVAVIATLDGADSLVDRRRLAHEATGDPHALDAGSPLASCTLALMVATGRVDSGLSPRQGWEQAGVAYDDVIGGLTMCGIAPLGWNVPRSEPVTIPPRVLATCTWPDGENSGPAGLPARAYVTENPSILTAVLDVGVPEHTAVICLSGTPSRVEVDALARLASSGWELYVRADFDDAGLAHVRAILAAAPSAVPWRLGMADYVAGLERSTAAVPLRLSRLGDTQWDDELLPAMASAGIAVFEESFCDELVHDVLTLASDSHRAPRPMKSQPRGCQIP